MRQFLAERISKRVIEMRQIAITIITAMVKLVNSILRNVYVPEFVYRRIYRCIVAVLVMVPAVSMATCIVVVVTPSNIFIGADGKQARRDNPSLFRLACKINRGIGRFYWAASSTFYLDETTGFDVETIINSVPRHSTLKETMGAIIATLKSPLIKELEFVRTREPDLFSKIISGEKQFLQIAVVGREKGTPVLVWTYFSAKAVNDQVTVNAIPLVANQPDQSDIGVVTLGVFEQANPYLKGHINGLRTNPVRTIEEAITVQAKASSQDVGPPISILRFGTSNIKWMEEGECGKKKPK